MEDPWVLIIGRWPRQTPGVCIFCRLIAGEHPAAKVYEDALTLAFMDMGQLNPGHTLIAVKRHAATLLDPSIKSLPGFQRLFGSYGVRLIVLDSTVVNLTRIPTEAS